MIIRHSVVPRIGSTSINEKKEVLSNGRNSPAFFPPFIYSVEALKTAASFRPTPPPNLQYARRGLCFSVAFEKRDFQLSSLVKMTSERRASFCCGWCFYLFFFFSAKHKVKRCSASFFFSAVLLTLLFYTIGLLTNRESCLL